MSNKKYVKVVKVYKKDLPGAQILKTDYEVHFRILPGFWETVKTNMLKTDALELIRIMKTETTYSPAELRIARTNTAYKKVIA